MEVLAAVYGLEDAGSEARRLEAAGVDGVFTFEGPHDVFIPLALAAAATDLSVMTNVAIAFPRNAVHMAHAAWDLHVLSGGRCTLGLGTQVRPHIEGRFGVDFDRPVERMRDAVEAVRSVFRTWQDGVPLEHRGPFRTHTRMSPMFSPPPHPAGPPRIAVGALGPRLTAMAAEVADALAVMPVTSEEFFTEVTLPAVDRGRTDRPSRLGPLEVLPELIVCCGRDAAEQAVADAGCRALLGFYVSTPAYRPVFERAGRGDLQPRAQQLTREGRWDALGDLIDDDLLSTVAVRGTPAQVASLVHRRYAGDCRRVCIYMPYAMADDLLVELVDALHGEATAAAAVDAVAR
ncbi:MAG TPA: TIGR03617 family F420-dependent LLM class oxidoreductase [Microthrixaceae bacterium]|nr:TIGR03617 family F420-dependent LLM class oxidoreductase [Microthrixaceae bacterium]